MRIGRKQQLPLRHHGVLTPPHDGARLVTVSVGPSQEAIALWSSEPGAAAATRRTGAEALVPYDVATYSPFVDRVVRLDGVTSTDPHVQPMPGGGFLLVDARCQWRESGADRNAQLFADDGSALTSATLGDGIAHAFTTAAGRLWLGFFDEGVRGNLGWGWRPGPEPLGVSGLVRHGPDLERQWTFDRQGGLPVIDDCYAMNVVGEVCWAYYYSRYPIIRIEDDVVQSWPTPVSGAHTLLVDEPHAALVGGSQDPGRVTIGTLTAGGFETTRDSSLPAPQSTGRKIARGARLHVFVGHDWFVADLVDWL